MLKSFSNWLHPITPSPPLYLPLASCFHAPLPYLVSFLCLPASLPPSLPFPASLSPLLPPYLPILPCFPPSLPFPTSLPPLSPPYFLPFPASLPPLLCLPILPCFPTALLPFSPTYLMFPYTPVIVCCTYFQHSLSYKVNMCMLFSLVHASSLSTNTSGNY